MENLKDLKIVAYRLSKGDYLGYVTFYDPKLPKPDRYIFRPSVTVMFQYETNPISLGQVISFDYPALEEYLKENDLMKNFIQLLDEATIHDDYKLV